jgi:hypothetical protein
MFRKVAKYAEKAVCMAFLTAGRITALKILLRKSGRKTPGKAGAGLYIMNARSNRKGAKKTKPSITGDTGPVFIGEYTPVFIFEYTPVSRVNTRENGLNRF